MAGTVAAVVLGSIFSGIVNGNAMEMMEYVFNASECTTEQLDVETMDVVFLLRDSVRNKTNGVTKSSSRNCTSDLTIQDKTQQGAGLEINFTNYSREVGISVVYHPGNSGNKILLFPRDTDKSTKCLTSSDSAYRLTVTYHIGQISPGKLEIFRTNGVRKCPEDLAKGDNSLPAEDPVIENQDEPHIGTVMAPKDESEKPPLDVIIATGVVACSLVGIAVAVFSIRRWIRNNAIEEQRQSAIRVNSRGSHTRSTSSSLQSGRGGAAESRMYGSVQVGGRLPSTDDDSDPFADAKSVRTMVDEV